jgi:NAD+ kinase
MRMGVVVKRGSELSYRVAKEVLSYGYNVLGLEMFLDEELSNEIQWNKLFRLGFDKVDFLIVIGGDGTLFRAIQRLKSFETPIIGIKTGRRGFLLDVDPREALDKLKKLVEGLYTVHEYMLLKIEPSTGEQFYALNDVIVASLRDTRSTIISLEVYVDNDLLYSLDGDGVIVATPVGSTAYTFSAGGPVVDENLEALIITPLAPLQTNAKPVILSPRRVIKIIHLSDWEKAVCALDGDVKFKLGKGDKISISRASTGVKIVRFNKFTTLKRLKVCDF